VTIPVPPAIAWPSWGPMQGWRSLGGMQPRAASRGGSPCVAVPEQAVLMPCHGARTLCCRWRLKGHRGTWELPAWRARQRERDRERGKERAREAERECVCLEGGGQTCLFSRLPPLPHYAGRRACICHEVTVGTLHELTVNEHHVWVCLRAHVLACARTSASVYQRAHVPLHMCARHHRDSKCHAWVYLSQVCRTQVITPPQQAPCSHHTLRATVRAML